MKIQKFKEIFLIFFSIILSLIIVNIPWFNKIPGYLEFDVFNYINMLDSGLYKISLLYEYNSFSSYILNEWLWRKLLVSLNDIGVGSHFIMLLIIPFLIYFFNLLILLKKNSLAYCWLLIHPIVLPFYLSQLRLAIAISLVFFILFFFKKSKVIYLLLIPIALIHTAVVLFLIIFLIVRYILNNISNKNILMIIFVVLGLILAYVTGPMMADILVAVGDRRADVYTENNLNSSFLSSLYWGVILVLFILSSLKMKVIPFELAVSIIFLSLIVFSPLFDGGYPYRFLSAVFILLILSLRRIDQLNRYLVLIVLFFTFVYQGVTVLNWV